MIRVARIGYAGGGTPVTSVGRNEPCPCGSGRKFKQCCLRAQDAEDSLRLQLRSAEGVLVPALFAYAEEEFGAEYLDEAWNEFFIWQRVPEALEDSREFGTTFDPFFVFSFVPDPADDDLPEGWPDGPLALHFLHHEVESAPDLHREFIEQACRSPASFFVVESVTPGRALDLRDILTGRRFRVLEQSASRTIKPGDVTFARVVTAGGGSIMIGACPWVIPARWHIPIIDMREELSPKKLLTREDLVECDIEIREAYHEIVHAMLHPAPPVLQNTDGDPLEPTMLTYDLDVTAAEAVERLTPLVTLHGETHICDEITDATGALVSACRTWIRAGNRLHKSWDNTTLGTLRVEGSRLVVEVNSARRRQRIEREIGKRFGPAATLIDSTVTDLADALARSRQEGSAGQAVDPASLEPPPTPELHAIQTELARRHWEEWLDTKVPALGHRTPRQAARTERGRERLEALLADYAQKRVGSRDAFAPDVGELRRKLGL